MIEVDAGYVLIREEDTFIDTCELDEYSYILSNEVKQRSSTDLQLSKGRKALVFISAFFLQFSSVGFLYALGVIYTEIVHTLQVNRAHAALVQSLTRGCTAGTGVVSGSMVQKYGEFPCAVLGTIFASMGLIISCFADNILTIILSTGVITGFGFSLLILVSVSSVSKIFTRNLGPVLASLTLGIAMGGICYPLLFEYLIQFSGWRGSFLIYSGLLLNNLACGIVIYFSMKKLSNEQTNTYTQQPIKWSVILKNPQYCIYAFCSIIIGMTCLVEIWFLVDDIVIKGYSRETGAYLLSVIGIAVLISRAVDGAFLAVIRTKAIFHVAFSLLVMGGSHILFARLHDYWPLFGTCIVYGTGLGIYAALTSVIALDFLGKENLTIGLGILNTAHGIGNSVGGLLGGHIYDVTGSYNLMFKISAAAEIVLSVICVLIMCDSRYLPTGYINRKHNGGTQNET